jgi:hypothetical protein
VLELPSFAKPAPLPAEVEEAMKRVTDSVEACWDWIEQRDAGERGSKKRLAEDKAKDNAAIAVLKAALKYRDRLEEGLSNSVCGYSKLLEEK